MEHFWSSYEVYKSEGDLMGYHNCFFHFVWLYIQGVYNVAD
jgi:hypothetical protein